MTSVIDEYRSRLRLALSQLQEMEAELEAVRAERTEPIAVIGMACRFPGKSNTPEAFFQNLENGLDAVTEVPPDRWSLPPFDAEMNADERAARWGAFLEHVDRFDASFFGISPREATSMDPQQRIILEVAWEALERAGQVVERLSETNTGVFVGVVQTDNLVKCASRPANELDFYDIVGNGHCFVAGRISYTFGFNGPAVTVDTACSSSLVAIHLACQSLRQRECDIVLSGGSNLMVEPFMTRLITTSHGLAPDGRCKTFDARANGFVRGEGVGIVVLKRLSDAQRDGDPILALIRGSAINQDGRSAGIAAPNVKAQEAVLRQALTNADLTPEDIGYIEMHGTGTPLGDPIEAAAIKSVIGKPRTDGSKCVLGAAKTNIAHIEAAAGVAGFMKAVLALDHERIPKNIHFNALNPRISFKDTPFLIPIETIPWKRSDKPRFAGVSSFGMSGTNAHIILEEAPVETAPAPPEEEQSAYLLPLSAKTPKALAELIESYAQWFSNPTNISLRDIVYTASIRRAHHDYRCAFVARTREEFANALAAFAHSETTPNVVQGSNSPQDAPRVVFVFPGQGSQWVGMGRQLLATEPVFRTVIEACDTAIRKESDFSVLEQFQAEAASNRIGDIDVVQPLLFAIGVALAALWRSWGINPDCVVGHSMGEVGAAYVAGILDLDDAARVICRRSRLLKRISGKGAMALVELPLAEAEAAITDYKTKLGVAVSNGPRSTVLSGDPEALDELLTVLESKGVFCRRVKVDVASHSPQVNPLRQDLLAALGEVKPIAGKFPMRSTVTGQSVVGPELNASYWYDNLREPVRFSQATRNLIAEGHHFFVEMSPHPILLPSIEENLKDLGVKGLALVSMRRQTDERRTMLEALSMLHTHGSHVDWNNVYPERGRSVSLPTYAWQQERFWVDAPKQRILVARDEGGHPLLGRGIAPESQPDLHVWEKLVTIEAIPYLADHRVQGEAVFPGAGYIEMAMAAAKEVYHDEHVVIEEIAFEQMLALPRDANRVVQFSLRRESAGHSTFTISSKPDGARDWIRHATGSTRIVAKNTNEPQDVARTLIQARCPTIITGREHYAQMTAQGLAYGGTFQGVTEVRIGTDELIANVTPPDDIANDAPAYVVHPGLLDSCIQATAWLLHHTSKETTFVPIRMTGVRLYERLHDTFWVYASVRTDQQTSDPIISLTVRNENGRILLEIQEIRAQALDAATRKKDDDPFEKCIFSIDWRKTETVPEPANVAPKPRSWLILSDQHELGMTLADQLRAQGDRVVKVRSADIFSRIDNDTYALNPTNIEHWEQILTHAFVKTGFHGAIHCGALDGATWHRTSSTTIDADIRRGPLTMLRIAQALLKQGWRDVPPIYVLTRAAQAVGTPATPLSPIQSMVWGLGRALVTEQPELRCVCIDLPAQVSLDEPSFILRELNSESDEDQIAMRADGRYVARLARSSWKDNGGSAERLEPAAHRPYRLEIREPGVLENLALRPLERREPGPGEVEIEVEAAGLNFRDVMVAMGIYPGLDRSSMILGGECSGRISAVGIGTTLFKVGQAVIAAAPFSFSSHVTVRVEFVVPKPQRLSFEEAAAIPSVFMTTQWALHHVARLRQGERILIHSATGGMGLAAIQYAQAVGAEVFATAGNEEKRGFLRSMGIKHVMDSRSTQFAEEVLAQTNGRGVDVVLNSLTGEALTRSLGVLAPYGRFLELGKKDIYENRHVGLLPFRKSLSYTAIDLGAMLEERPADYGALLTEVVSKFEEGTFQPEPATIFGTNEASGAFRLMAQAKHIGKIVVRMRDSDACIRVSSREGMPLSSKSTYMITGGLGGLGLSLAKWMVNQGARHLMLVGRSAPTETARTAITEMLAMGCDVQSFRADVARRSDVDAVIAHIHDGMPPLRGIVHAAGVLADRTVPHMDEPQFYEAINPKVFGAWNLHEATRNIPLDFFVMYSSGAGVVGSPGQANYAAANTFLDALSHARVADGLAGMSIQWGNFSDVGLAAASDLRGNRMVARGGAAFTPSEGNSLFERLLARPRPEVGIMHFDARQWMEFYPHLAGAPFFSELTRNKGVSDVTSTGDFRSELERKAPAQRLGMIEAQLAEQLGKVLRLEPEKIDKRTPFVNLGIDSLMSLELRNRLEGAFGIKLSAALLFSYSTTNALANHLLERILPAPAPPNSVLMEITANTSDSSSSNVEVGSFEQQDESALVDKLGEFEEYLK